MLEGYRWPQCLTMMSWWAQGSVWCLHVCREQLCMQHLDSSCLTYIWSWRLFLHTSYVLKVSLTFSVCFIPHVQKSTFSGRKKEKNNRKLAKKSKLCSDLMTAVGNGCPCVSKCLCCLLRWMRRLGGKIYRTGTHMQCVCVCVCVCVRVSVCVCVTTSYFLCSIVHLFYLPLYIPPLHS